MNEQSNRAVSTSAVGIITEALREIVPDVGLRVRRTFAFDEHGMTPLEFVGSLGASFGQGHNGFSTRGVSFLLVPMTVVFAPMAPGEASMVHVLERRLAFLEACTKYTHQFYREAIARELETAPHRGQDQGAPALVKRISELCLQLLEEDALRESLTAFWLESQHSAVAASRTVYELTAERLAWTAGSDRFELNGQGMSWERNGRCWFSSSHIDGTEHPLSYQPTTQMYGMLADDAPAKPTISLVR